MVGGVAGAGRGDRARPRIGKFDKNGKPIAMPGHHIPMAIVGTFILAFGWFGFNPGSTLAGTDLRIAVVATNTMLAGTGGAITAMLFMMWKFGKPDPSMMCNGLLAGLVAITAPCAFVTALGVDADRRDRRRAGRACGVLHRAHAEDRRSGRRDLRARRERRLGRVSARASSPTAPTATAGTASPAR